MSEVALKARPDNLKPQDIVIFGGTGSLARLKLFPALYDLTADGHMPPGGKVIGLARSAMSLDAYRELARQAVQPYSRNEYDEDTWAKLAARLEYITVDGDGYDKLKSALTQPERLVFLAIPPLPSGRRRARCRQGPGRGHASAGREAVRP